MTDKEGLYIFFFFAWIHVTVFFMTCGSHKCKTAFKKNHCSCRETISSHDSHSFVSRLKLRRRFDTLPQTNKKGLKSTWSMSAVQPGRDGAAETIRPLCPLTGQSVWVPFQTSGRGNVGAVSFIPQSERCQASEAGRTREEARIPVIEPKAWAMKSIKWKVNRRLITALLLGKEETVLKARLAPSWEFFRADLGQ